jgi:hypothetical protein
MTCARWLVCALAAGALALPSAALADDSTQAAADMNDAVAAQQAPAAVAPADTVATDDGAPVFAAGDAAEAAGPAVDPTTDAPVSLTVPADGGGDQTADTTVYDGSGQDNQIGVQQLDNGGTRALVRITSPDAPERYDFQVGGAAARLVLQDDGSVEVLDADGQTIAEVPAPWATDANGVAIPTHYEVDGTTLTQVVEHRGGDYAYPIVADPSFWHVLKCVGAITWVVGTTIFAVGKLTKIKAGIKALGGIKSTAELLLKVTGWSEKMRAIGPVMAGAAADLLGITAIRDNC